MLDNKTYYDLPIESVMDLASVAQCNTFKVLLQDAYLEQQRVMQNLDATDPKFNFNYLEEQTKLRSIHSMIVWINSLVKRFDTLEETGELPDAQELTSID